MKYFKYSILCLLCLLAACSGGKKEELAKYIKTVKSRPPAKIQPMPSFKNQEGYAYSANTKRSPFKKRDITAQEVDNNKPDMNRPKEPLEAYALDTLFMVGILGKGDSVWALISTPDGSVHYVKPGDYLGQNFGKVVRITPDEINLMETVQGTSGWEQRPASLVLAADKPQNNNSDKSK